MADTLDPFDESTWNEDQRWYFEHVDQALETGEDVIISNGKPEHAVFLIHRFLENATEVVRLFSGRLAQTYGGVEIYRNRYVGQAAEKALQSGTDIRIVLEADLDVEGENPDHHPLVRLAQELREAGELAGTLEIKKASSASIRFLKDKEFRYHWMTMDDQAYRLETDTKNTKAHVNFGTPQVARSLATIFDNTLWPDATEIVAVAA